MLFLFLSACTTPAEDTLVSRWEPADVVVAVVVDTLAWHRLRPETTPNIASFFTERGVWMPKVLATRGLTSVATASLLTGTYPRKHQIRSNEGWSAPPMPTLIERFDAAGYFTIGLAANACQFIESTDAGACTWAKSYPEVPLTARDAWLLDALPGALDQRPADQPLFIWVHLISPHHPYQPVEEHFGTFLPEGNSSTLDTSDTELLESIVLGKADMSDEDLARLRAAYDSRVRYTDDNFKELLDILDSRSLLDEAVVLFGSDHGESLWTNSNYFFHGCSPYTDVLRVPFGLVAPDRLPAGATVEGWVSQVDIGPTLADAAGIGWTGDRDGVTLIDDILGGRTPDRPVFAERGERTVTVVHGDWSYVLSPDGGYTGCRPYSPTQPYPGQQEALFDLRTDPLSANNIALQNPEQTSTMKKTLCSWLSQETWSRSTQQNGSNDLLERCN